MNSSLELLEQRQREILMVHDAPLRISGSAGFLAELVAEFERQGRNVYRAAGYVYSFDGLCDVTLDPRLTGNSFLIKTL
jgi:hypothetical protein